MRIGDWIQTYNGRQFWPLDPDANEIALIDIAAALSKQCRYAGHCRRFYSVAEHCVLMAEKLPMHLRRGALMHDASEAYLVDIPRPIKSAINNYREIEDTLMLLIALKYDFAWPVDPAIKAADDAMLHDEMLQNMAVPPAPWSDLKPPLGVELQFWSPTEAMCEFLSAAHSYGVRP